MTAMGGSITRYLTGVKVGDPRAVRVIFDRCRPEVIRFAKQRLAKLKRRAKLPATISGRAYQEVEFIDVAVLGSFFRCAKRGQVRELERRRDLWRILTTLTNRKVANMLKDLRKHLGQVPGRADQNPCPRPVPPIVGMIREELIRRLMGLLDEPDQVLRLIALVILQDVFGDEIHRLTGPLDENTRNVLQKMKGEPLTHMNIAKAVGRARSTVERKLDLLARTWGEEMRA